MYGIPGPWLFFILIVVAVVGMVGFALIDTRRLDARIRRDRERAAAEPRPEK